MLGGAIKQARKERYLTQEKLGELVGVKKAQTILKVFKALNAKINYNIELLNQSVKLV